MTATLVQPLKWVLVLGDGHLDCPVSQKLINEGYMVLLVHPSKCEETPNYVKRISADRTLEGLRTAFPQCKGHVETFGQFHAVVDLNGHTPDDVTLALSAFGDMADHCIYLSDYRVYPQKLSYPPDENTLTLGRHNRDGIGEWKAAAEACFMGQVKTSATVLRTAPVVGPLEYFSPDDLARGGYAAIWAAALQRKNIIVPGNGKGRMQFLGVDDLGMAICAILRNNLKGITVYNVASPEQFTCEEWTRMLVAITGCDVEVRPQADIPLIQRILYTDCTGMGMGEGAHCWMNTKRIQGLGFVGQPLQGTFSKIFERADKKMLESLKVGRPLGERVADFLERRVNRAGGRLEAALAS